LKSENRENETLNLNIEKLKLKKEKTMSKYLPGKLNLSDSKKDQIIENLMKIASAVDDKSDGMKKVASTLSADDKERMISNLFNDPTGRGMKRIAYAGW
jgi:hypothetical protein